MNLILKVIHLFIIFYLQDLINTDETLHTLHPNRGLQCKDDDQPEGIKCSDYKVRYLCPTGNIIFFTKCLSFFKKF